MAVISVIVPVYNAEKYLNRCIDSILDQTFKDFELILVDDGSKDSSGDICEKYAGRDQRIKVIHQENKGQAAARNRGVLNAAGEWIAFVDADDMIQKQMLEYLYQAVDSAKVKLAVCKAAEGKTCPIDFKKDQEYRCTAVKADENILLQWCTEDHIDLADKYVYWIVWAKLIHRSLLEQYPFIEGKIYEDNAVVFKWIYTASSIAVCDNVMYFYYVNSEGTTKKAYSLKRLDWLWAVQEQISFYKEVGFNKMEYMLRKQYVWEALREYEHITALNREKHAAKKLRRQIVLHCIQNRTKISLAYSEKMEILSRLYPKIVQGLSGFKKRIRQ